MKGEQNEICTELIYIDPDDLVEYNLQNKRPPPFTPNELENQKNTAALKIHLLLFNSWTKLICLYNAYFFIVPK